MTYTQLVFIVYEKGWNHPEWIKLDEIIMSKVNQKEWESYRIIPLIMKKNNGVRAMAQAVEFALLVLA